MASEAYCACTAVAARSLDGSVTLARTLDWEFPELKQLNVDLRTWISGQFGCPGQVKSMLPRLD